MTILPGSRTATTTAAVTVALVAIAVYTLNDDQFMYQMSKKHQAVLNSDFFVQHAALSQALRVALTPSDATAQAFGVWKLAVHTCARDVSTAAYSSSIALYLTLRPLVGLAAQMARGLLLLVYEHIIIRGILSPTAVAQVKRALKSALRWQLSRTPKQWAAQAALGLALVVLYQLVQLLKRRNYLERVKRWGQRKRRAVGKYYSNQLQRLATVSVWLAIMTPHTLFLSICIGANVLMHNVCAWLATETYLTCVWYIWYPFVATIRLLYDVSVSKEVEELDKKIAEKNASKKKNRRESLVDFVNDSLGSSNISLDERKTFWLQYWMVCGAIAAGKRLFHIIPFAARIFMHPTIVGILCQLELVFWIWVNVLPACTTLHYQVPPVQFLATRIIGPPVHSVWSKVAGVVPLDAWQLYCVAAATKVLGVAVWTKGITQETADALTHILQESRGLLVPALTVFSWPLQAYGIVYVAYAVPLAKSHVHQKQLQQQQPNNASTAEASTLQLQVWVLHTILTFAVHVFSGALWWIPFSNVAVFAAYAYLVISKDVPYEKWVQRELQAFDLLPRSANDDEETLDVNMTNSVRAFNWVMKKLPSAQDETAEDNDPQQQQPQPPTILEEPSVPAQVADDPADDDDDTAAFALANDKGFAAMMKQNDALLDNSSARSSASSTKRDEDYLPEDEKENGRHGEASNSARTRRRRSSRRTIA